MDPVINFRFIAGDAEDASAVHKLARDLQFQKGDVIVLGKSAHYSACASSLNDRTGTRRHGVLVVWQPGFDGDLSVRCDADNAVRIVDSDIAGFGNKHGEAGTADADAAGLGIAKTFERRALQLSAF